MQTIPERIADHTQAIERHKRLLVLLASWAKTHEAVMERSVGALRTVRTATEQLERQLAEAEEAFAKLEQQEPVISRANPPRCPTCGYTAEDAMIHGDHALCSGTIPTSQPPEPKHE